MAATRYRLSINLERETSFEILHEAFQDFSAIFRFARDVQVLADRNEAALRLLRERGPEFEDLYWPASRRPYGWSAFSGDLALPLSAAFERAIEADLARRETIATVMVEQLTYGSPFSFNLNVNGDFIARILEIIRDWTTDRRVARAEATAREAEARARTAAAEAYEEQSRLEQDIYRRLREQLVLDERPAVSQRQLDGLETDRVIRALVMLEKADLRVDFLEVEQAGE
jgi:hypothetical protein